MAALAVVAQAEGLRLHLSSSSSTGYKAVIKQASGRFVARHYVDGRRDSLGCFNTAVEAAVAYAKKVGEAPALVSEAEGLQLHLSVSSSTGYKGVFKQPSGRFRTQRKVDGRMVTIGTFDTALEGAVAYARAVLHPSSSAAPSGPSASAAASASAPSSMGHVEPGGEPEALPPAAHSLLLSLPPPLTGLG